MNKDWCDNPGCANYKDAFGNYPSGRRWATTGLGQVVRAVQPRTAPTTWKVANMRRFEVFGSINNLFDKTPPFTGGGISGASPQYHDTYGRAYRMGVRLQF